MNLKIFFITIISCAFLTSSTISAAEPVQKGKTSALLEKSAKEKKSTLIFVWKEKNEKTAAMLKVFENASRKMSAKANSIKIKLDDSQERDIVLKYRLNIAPMPLVITIAPNGAVTGGFPVTTTVEKLENSIVCECEAECMKNLQMGKVVFVCIQDKNTKFNAEAMKGINDYIKEGNEKTTHVIKVSPNDQNAKKFLQKLGIVNPPATATTVLLKPPGVIGATFQGATSKEKIKIVACTKGCC